MPCPRSSGLPSMKKGSPGGSATSWTRTETGCASPPAAHRLVAVLDFDDVPRSHRALYAVEVDDLDRTVVAVVAPELPLGPEQRAAFAVQLDACSTRSLDQDEAHSRVGSLGPRHCSSLQGF